MQKNKPRQRPHILHKNYLEMDHRLKSKMQNCETSRKKTGKNLHDLGFDDRILDIIPKARSIEKNISWTSLKLKTCSVRGTVKRK